MTECGVVNRSPAWLEGQHVMMLELFLAEAPAPQSTDDRSDLIQGVGEVMGAHLKAIVDMAYDLEIQAGKELDR